jgi:hypothetical protein
MLCGIEVWFCVVLSEVMVRVWAVFCSMEWARSECAVEHEVNESLEIDYFAKIPARLLRSQSFIVWKWG